jgi:aminopeptidase N
MSTEIERTTDIWKVLEEWILNSKVELWLREVLGITKEVHDSIVDLVKRKRLLTEPEPEKPVEVLTLESVNAQDQQKETANNLRVAAPDFQVGDMVWLLRRNITTTRPCSKLDYAK